ncbi:MAG: M50 family metallopeptidase [Acidobacteriota bacterium]|nr:M50 family metallopeptidase [Acidobacteriota bacterium]
MTQLLQWLYPVFTGIIDGALAMLFHELGHIVMALMLGVRVKHVGLRWKGLYTVREAGPPGKNIVISLAGPAVNFILCFLLPYSFNFALANFCIGLGNLIPIRGSDGYRALYTTRYMAEDKAAKAAQ